MSSLIYIKKRWRIEDAFNTVKRLLGLSYLWTGSINGIKLQIWATWLFYAVLVDLGDSVADELSLPFDRISLEMIYRGLYYFHSASQRGETQDPVRYFSNLILSNVWVLLNDRENQRKS